MIKYTFYPVVNRNGLTVKGQRRKVMVPAMVMITITDDGTIMGGRQTIWYNRVPVHLKRRRDYSVKGRRKRH